MINAGLFDTDFGRILDVRSARYNQLGGCFGFTDGAYPYSATTDDGSTATTSGTQVTEVPEGYADTGAW